MLPEDTLTGLLFCVIVFAVNYYVTLRMLLATVSGTLYDRQRINVEVYGLSVVLAAVLLSAFVVWIMTYIS